MHRRGRDGQTQRGASKAVERWTNSDDCVYRRGRDGKTLRSTCTKGGEIDKLRGELAQKRER